MKPSLALPRISPTARRHWAAWLVVALLWAQALGAWHHTVHAPGLQPARAAGVADVGAAAYDSPLHHTALSADCRLLDQLLLADGLAAPPALPLVLPAQALPAQATPVERPALAALRPYLARAPPSRG